MASNVSVGAAGRKVETLGQLGATEQMVEWNHRPSSQAQGLRNAGFRLERAARRRYTLWGPLLGLVSNTFAHLCGSH